MPCRSASHSIVGPEARQTASTMRPLASPWFLRWMSEAISSAESLPRWKRVGAAGTKPEESAVEPDGL
jgi:hypothetical protein